MATSRDTNGGDSQDDSLDHDSSTAMSLDESSIALNATAAQTPLSVDMTGASFARGGARGVGVGRRSNAFAAATPNFSPLASESASMSISGMDTPMTFASNRGTSSRGVLGGVMNGGGGIGKGRNDHDAADIIALKNSMPPNGNGGGDDSMGKKPSINLNLSRLNNYNDGTDDAVSNTKNSQLAATATGQETINWNSNWDLEQARTQLRRASRECSRRGLKLASRWASEQLMGLALPPPGNISQPHQQAQIYAMEDDVLLAEECCRPNDMELYAISLFDLGEYSRAAHVLSTPASSTNSAAASPTSDGSLGQINPPHANLTPLGIYLRAFSLYLEGERRKEEQVTELRDPLERTSLHNANLPRLEAELRRANALGNLDAFGLYVYGVVLKELRGAKVAPSSSNNTTLSEKKGTTEGHQQGDAAHRILVRSILMYPFNWSAWLDLGELCVDDPSIDQEVEELLLPISDHWMYHFFCVQVFIENKANENAIAIIEQLANGDNAMAEEEDGGDMGQGENENASASGFFVQSAYLQAQLAMAYYDVRDYDSAHEHFLALSEREPYRLDHMDAFSNVLYVKDQKVALSHLAHRSVTVDKYRPETCIIVGNYYSSKGRHEKAVQYFQRALKLDRTYLSAWTLLGHEYIEMKNTAAAIEAYRRAVDISDREYRAWYGLGQTYEIMNMLLHALFYFRKAAALHPHDARMWCAIGGCLLGLDRRTDAEKSYERAVSLGDGEGIATRKLAELYREDGDEEKAAKCYLRHLELRYQSQLPGSFSGASADTSPAAFETVVTHVRVDEPEAEALLYLAYYYRDNLEYDQAILCATRLEDYPGPEKEQGKGLLRDIRSRMDQKAGERKQGRSSSSSPSTPAMGLRSRRDLSMDSKSAANAESSFEFSP
ncbi:hypothetical protein ACHAXR_009397 [Thalassiosira sp. AJA248-18]